MDFGSSSIIRISTYLFIVAVSLSWPVHASNIDEPNALSAKTLVASTYYKPNISPMKFANRISNTANQTTYFSNLNLNKSINLNSFSNQQFLTNEENTNSKKVNRYRAALEISLFIGAGLVGYNYWQEKMEDDWEFEYKSFNDYLERFVSTDQIKFDDNSILYNWGHVYAGAFYYQVGRVNGFSNYESLLISTIGSSVWEYIIEFREAISINDQIMTSVGGAILGETFHQMASLLKRRSKTPFSKLLATYFQPIDIFESFFDKKGIALDNFEPQPIGFIRNNIEKFDIFSGIKSVDQVGEDIFSVIEFGMQGELVNLPVTSEGSLNKQVLDTVAVELIQEFGVTASGLRDYYSYTKVVPSAFFSKQMSENQSGYAMFIGPAAGTEYNSRGFDHNQDFYAIANLLGATLDLSLYKNKKSLRMAFDAYGNFAFVRPYGTNQYFEAGNSYLGAKTILRKKNYYYAIGTSLRSRIEAKPTNKIGLGVTGIYHKLKSFDEGAKDRHAEDVNRSLELKDRVASLKAWASYEPKHRWKISAAIEHIYRSGNIDETASGETQSFYISDTETTYKLQFNYDIL